MRTSFLIGIKPLPAESLRSCLARLADVNGYPRLFRDELASLKTATATAESVFFPTRDDLPPASRFGWTEEAVAGKAAVRLGDVYFLPRCVRLRSRAICAECLEARPFSRCDWEFNVVTACAVHGTRLTRTCPTCSYSLTWERTQLLSCVCGHRLTDTAAEKASAWEVRLARQMRTAIHIAANATRRMTKGPGGWPPLRLDKLLLLIDVIEHVVLPKYLQAGVSSKDVSVLTAGLLNDPSYRQHLWDRVFLHAAADPAGLREALLPGGAANEVAARFAPIAPLIWMHPLIRKRLAAHTDLEHEPVFASSGNLLRYSSLNAMMYDRDLEDEICRTPSAVRGTPLSIPA